MCWSGSWATCFPSKHRAQGEAAARGQGFLSTWRFILLQNYEFPLSSDLKIELQVKCFCLMSQRHYQAWPSPMPENLNMRLDLRPFGFADICRSFAFFCGPSNVNFFRQQFSLRSPQPWTFHCLSNVEGIGGVSGVGRQNPWFSEKR